MKRHCCHVYQVQNDNICIQLSLQIVILLLALQTHLCIGKFPTSSSRTYIVRQRRQHIHRISIDRVLKQQQFVVNQINSIPRGGDVSVTGNDGKGIVTEALNSTFENQHPINDTNATSTIIIATTLDQEKLKQEQEQQYQKDCMDRAHYIKQLLIQRYKYVQSGKRMKDITHWMKHHHPRDNNDDDDEYLLSLSTHNSISKNYNDTSDNTGTNNITPQLPNNNNNKNKNNNNNNKNKNNNHKTVKRNHNKNDPFPYDRRNLNFDTNDDDDISSTTTTTIATTSNTKHTPSNCFIDTTGEMSLDIRPPTILQLSSRMIQLMINFTPIWSTFGIALCSTYFRQQYWYKWITNSISQSGPAWIKWGQWSATRNDIFPEILCNYLSTLHAAAPAHKWSYTELTIEQSLGLGTGSIQNVFDEFDTEPIASGSIAQVHKAILCGIPVAVKVRHPNVRQLMEMDFRLMTIVASIMDHIPTLSWLHIRESVEQFSYTISAQAQLHIEAHHLELLNYNFRNWKSVSFPKPIFASSSTIIESFESGNITTDIIDKYNDMAITINNNIKVQNNNTTNSNGVTVIEADDDDINITENVTIENNATVDEPILSGHDLMPIKLAKFLVSTGVSLYLKMLLIDNLMHADLHPGNIMVDTKYRNKSPIRKFLTNKEKQLSLYDNDLSHQQMLRHEVLSAMDESIIDELRITLVDAGMVVKLTDEESSAFIGLLSSLGEGNGDEAAEYTLRFSLERNRMTIAEKRYFVADMVLLFKDCCRGYGTDVDVGQVLRGVLTLIRKHRVRIDANFATLVINCLCIESLARRVCPSYNVLDAGRPLLQGYRRFVDQKDRGRPIASPWFTFRMSLNALKKDIDDRLFFRRRAKYKVAIYQTVDKLLQE